MENNLKLTSTNQLTPVVVPVLTNKEVKYSKVKSVKYAGKSDVYNMEVQTYHNFSVNNGLIVHNCIDALRYSMQDEMTSKQSWGWQ